MNQGFSSVNPAPGGQFGEGRRSKGSRLVWIERGGEGHFNLFSSDEKDVPPRERKGSNIRIIIDGRMERGGPPECYSLFRRRGGK